MSLHLTIVLDHPLVHLITFVYIHAASFSLALLFFPQFPYTIVDDDDNAHPLTHTYTSSIAPRGILVLTSDHLELFLGYTHTVREI